MDSQQDHLSTAAAIATPAIEFAPCLRYTACGVQEATGRARRD
jgi:hypothetical protein